MESVHVSTKSIQDYITPPELVQFLERRFGVDLMLDLAASAENTRCKDFITQAEDESFPIGGIDWGLRIQQVELDFHVPKGCMASWLNPPFKKAAPFMARAAQEGRAGNRIIALTLTSLATDWYQDWVEPNALILILKERVTFVGQPTAYPKELMVSLFGFGMRGLGRLSWKAEAYANYRPPMTLDLTPPLTGENAIPVPIPLFEVPMMKVFAPDEDEQAIEAQMDGMPEGEE